MVAHAASQLCSVITKVTVVTGCEHDAVAAALTDLPVTLLRNSEWREGLSSSLRLAVRQSAAADGLLISLCDLPLIPTSHYRDLLENWHVDPTLLVSTSHSGLHTVPAILPRRVFRQLESLSGDQGARSLIKNEEHLVSLPCANAAFDLDNPEDLEQLMRRRLHNEPD